MKNTSPTAQEPRFAEPIYWGKRRVWKLSDLLKYEAAVAGETMPDQLPPEDERFLTAAQVRERYGGVSDMWIWRRLNPKQAASGSPEAT